MEVGHGLKSCTKEIHIATTHVDGYDVHLIDTPGFNDDDMQDSDILRKIAEYLETGVRLSGILYLHPITDSRMGGAGKRNLDLLRNLVGSENMGNVKLITTKWCGVTDQESEVRLDDLLSDFWKEMVDNGADIDRYDGTVKDGKRIIQSILRTAPVTLLFQEELRKGFQLAETSAGKSLKEELNKLQEKYDRRLRELKDDAAAEREKYEEALWKRDEVAEQVRKLHEGEIKEMQGRIGELEKRWCLVM
ncbi:p-loop containing nucleoside triphosphate hydrolase protein [Pleurostoma richardsiae]|uniref:P-loop containing nucleoside triphosphate hydrolase protein n=1 Tax=Pleurostoma richardsiae TaxID=41990 RepID=A0AA38VAY6_9PEZI|nr:p-loop containing nucleoside triphosphate hydrolase protein [Pleurostoma richardsiae]